MALQQSLILTAQILAVLITKPSLSCPTCDKKEKKKRTVYSTWKPPAAESINPSHSQRGFTQGGVDYLKKQSIGLRGVLFHMLCNYKKYMLNYRICGRGWKLLAWRLGVVKSVVWISDKTLHITAFHSKKEFGNLYSNKRQSAFHAVKHVLWADMR